MDTSINWGEPIEKAYQQFLSYGHQPNWSGWEVYPSMFYDQLVKDKFIAVDTWRQQMPEAKKFLINRLQYDYTVTQMRYSQDVITRKMELGKIEAEIKKYRKGEYDDRVALIAKAWLVLTLFRMAKKKGVEKIYFEEKVS